jgi:hypothetical protein
LPPPLPSSQDIQSVRPGQVRVSAARSDSSEPESAGSTRSSRDLSPPGRSESAGLIRVVRRDPSPHGQIRVYVRFRIWPLRPPVRSSHDGRRSPVHYLKGVRGYRTIARRRQRSLRRRRPGATPVGHCAAWVQLPRSAARSARLSTRAAGPGDLFQRRCLRGGSSPANFLPSCASDISLANGNRT